MHKEEVRRIFIRQGEALHFMNKYSNFVAMLAVPLITSLFWLFYLRGKYNYTEHLVGCMYMIGFTNLVYALIFMPLSVSFLKNSSMIGIITLISFQTTYYSIFYHKFINSQAKYAVAKVIGVSLFTVLFWVILSGFLVGLYITNGFWGLVK